MRNIYSNQLLLKQTNINHRTQMNSPHKPRKKLKTQTTKQRNHRQEQPQTCIPSPLVYRPVASKRHNEYKCGNATVPFAANREERYKNKTKEITSSSQTDPRTPPRYGRNVRRFKTIESNGISLYLLNKHADISAFLALRTKRAKNSHVLKSRGAF